MFPVLRGARKALCKLAVLATVGLVAACNTTVGNFGGSGPQVNTNKPIPVALLIPVSDENASGVARSLENAARLAIASFEGVEIDLRVYDTAGQAPQAAALAQQAVDEGAKVILGPLFGEAANAAALAVADEGINVLSFSNNTSIAGGNLFVLGATFENTADRLMGYAASQGKSTVAIVHPDNVEGAVGKLAIERAARRNAVSVVAAQSFPFSQTGVAQSVTAIRSAVNSSGADSVFLTSTTAGALPLLLQLMPEGGVDPAAVQYIGLSNWKLDPRIQALKGAQGGWFAVPNEVNVTEFTARYNAAYGQPPHPLAGLAFDGMAAIGALVAQGRGDALTAEALTLASGFRGSGGVFRLMPDGTNQRALAVATVENNQVVLLDPAPTSFATAGF